MPGIGTVGRDTAVKIETVSRWRAFCDRIMLKNETKNCRYFVHKNLFASI